MKIHQNFKKNRLGYWVLIMLLLIIPVPAIRISATGLSYFNYNTGKQETYVGRQVTYIYNNRTLGMDYPGIIINDIALADAENLFAEQLGLAVSYNATLNQIAISDGKNTILMQPGSKTATVNGVLQTMSEVPVRLRFSGESKDKLYVPTRFVCQALGYTYLWSASNNTVKITKTLHLSINDKEVNYIGTLYSINYMNQAVDFGQMPILVYNGSLLVRAKKLCEAADCKFSQMGDEITITKGNISILFYINQDYAYVNGKRINLDGKIPYYITNTDTEIGYIYVPLEIFAEYLGFDMWYNDTHKQYTLLESARTGNPDAIEALKNYDKNAAFTGQPSDIENDDYYFLWTCQSEYETLLENRANAIHNIYTGTSTSEPGTFYPVYSQVSKENTTENFYFGTTDYFQSIDSYETNSGFRLVISHAKTSTNGSISLNYAMVDSYTVYDESSKEQVVLDFSFRNGIDSYEYSIEISDDGKELCVSVYPKYLTKVSAYSMNCADILELQGVQYSDITSFYDQGTLIFELPATFNCVGTQYYASSQQSYMTQCFIKDVAGKTKLQFQLGPDTDYFMTEEDNAVKVYFFDAVMTVEEVLDQLEKPDIKLPEDKLIIPLPKQCSISSITDQDNYSKNNIKILIKGNQKELIEKKGIKNPYSMVKNIRVTYDSATNYTTVSMDTSYLCGYKYEIFENYLIVTIGKPKEIYSKIVLLDPGHGGIDPGANYNKVYEKTLNYKILYTYVKEYFANSDIKVYYTRESDVLIDLYQRADFAKEVNADLFISLHMNANKSSAAKGTQVFYCSANNSKQPSGLTSKQMARLFVDNLSKTMNTSNRGISSAEYVVIKYNTVPAVLIELGFMSNSSDFAKLTDTTYQKKAAKTIYDTIEQIFKTYPTGR